MGHEYPVQPEEKEWGFIEELKIPLHQKIDWRKRSAKQGEASLRRGVTVEARFDDPQARLETAYADFDRFLEMAGIKKGGPYRIVIDRIETDLPETHRIVVTEDSCTILANDTEGIRRGLVYLEDEMLRAAGPFLPLGTMERRPVIRTRISRCFYSPIHRPPKNRDELADDVNYYPDEYLNRLAHHGINGLWLTIRFAETIPSKIIPEYGRDAERRLEKLRLTVERCGRYGIKVYAFCIEPAAFATDSPVLAAHPELGGHRDSLRVYFCPSSELGRAYLEEATQTLFSQVPGLGGLIDITVGERATHCYSVTIGEDRPPNNCPRCSTRKPEQVLAEVLAAMERGMHSVAPEAELISWPYSQLYCWGPELMISAAAQVPKGVILQHNFETGGRQRQLGKWRTAGDYWLSYIGPSDIFRDCARFARAKGNRVFAKLQVGNSHEVADVPCVPVPGNLYQKYQAMHELGVSGAMQCWFFGNYPSIMTKAAVELSFAPFPETEEEFLLKLAQRDWPKHARKVVKAWKYFQRGYGNYPINAIFGYYGPMQDGVVWPLYLEPKDLPLSPTWQINYPPSGDRIGECLAYGHTLEEAVILCRRMAENWNQGVSILKQLIPFYQEEPERIRDIGLATALGLQFRSGFNLLKFYYLREKMMEKDCPDRWQLLREMKEIVELELAGNQELLHLAESDSRLGFHSEAEGYKYFPESIRWRMNQLRDLLANEFPAVERQIKDALPLFPEYTGEQPQGKVYRCKRVSRAPRMNGKPFGGVWDELAEAECEYQGLRTHDLEVRSEEKPVEQQITWKAGHDERAIYFGVSCRYPDRSLMPADSEGRPADHRSYSDLVNICIEPKRFWPSPGFLVNRHGIQRCLNPANHKPWRARVRQQDDGWSLTIRIPFKCLGTDRSQGGPMRVNVLRALPDPQGRGSLCYAWPQLISGQERLHWGFYHRDNLGWLLFE